MVLILHPNYSRQAGAVMFTQNYLFRVGGSKCQMLHTQDVKRWKRAKMVVVCAELLNWEMM